MSNSRLKSVRVATTVPISECLVHDGRSPNSRRPRVAVLIPCFNAETYLARALSALRNNHEPHDIVLVDDGSTSPLAASFQTVPENTVILRLPRNCGIVVALNTGLTYMKEQGYTYAARLDADDWCAPDRLAKQVRLLNQNAEIAVVGTWFAVCDLAGVILWSEFPPADPKALATHLYYRNCLAHSSLAYRVRDVMESGGYDPRFRGSEDYDLIRRFSRCKRVAVVPELLTYYQITPGSITSRRFRQFLVHLRVAAHHFVPWNIHSYLGFSRSIFALLTPKPIADRLKRLRSKPVRNDI